MKPTSTPIPETDEPRSPLTLALGPARAGKTDWVLERFLAAEGRALVIVASTPQAETLTRLLAERTGSPEADMRGGITHFHGLVSDLLQPAHPEDFRLIGRDFQRLLLTDLFHTHIRQDDFFGRMLDAPGFIPALCERLREWKLACITPEALEQGALLAAESLQDPTFLRKTSELARLFHVYESFLRRNRLRDEEDCLRDAAIRLVTAPAPLPNNANLILLDGFYRFNRAQRRVLSALAGRGMESGKPEIEVAITLPYEADRPLLFVAPERTLNILRAEFTTTELFLPARTESSPSLLTTLAASLFDTVEGKKPRPALSDEGQRPLLLFDAPNPYVEAEMVAREFRRLQAERDYAWSDFAVILRGMGDYAPILAAVFERYEIPLGVDGPEALAENPLLKTLLTLFSLIRHDWPREEVLAFLKSSYTAPDKVEADRLRRAAQSFGLRDGRTRWLQLLAKTPIADSVTETIREMSRLHDLLTGHPAAPADFIAHLEECITVFGLEERIATGERNRIERDREALKQGMALLQDLAQMALLSGRNMMTFAEFHEALLMVWEGATSLVPSGRDVVCVCEPYDSRERPLKVAAVMGLTERVFPRRVTEDPFLRDEERIALRERAGLDLEIQKGRVDDERFFFYLAVTAPSEILRLSYPRSTNESDTLPSFYLDEVRAVIEQASVEPSIITSSSQLLPTESEFESPLSSSASYTLSRTLADVAPRPDECITDQDRLRAACAGLFDPGPVTNPNTAQIRQRAAALMAGCLESTLLRPHLRAIIVSRFLPRWPRLESGDLRAHFAGQNQTYTIAALETYQRCPFQYLLRYVLRLHPDEESGDTRVQGALLHSVLRRYYRRHAARKVSDPVPDLGVMRAELRDLLTDQLERETLDVAPSRLLMVRQLLESGLDRFAERELRFREQFGMMPTHAHLTFGMENAAMREREPFAEEGSELSYGDDSSAQDPASCAAPLILTGADGGPAIALRGVIDRVDYDFTGQRALMLDYRFDTPPDYDEIQRGQSLQLPLSLLALERVFGKIAAVACYDSLFEDGRRRLFRTEHVNLRQFAPLLPLDDPPTVRPLNRTQFAELTKTAEEVAVRTARAIGEAHIGPTPGKHCRACPYNDICRTNPEGVHDGESPIAPLPRLG